MSNPQDKETERFQGMARCSVCDKWFKEWRLTFYKVRQLRWPIPICAGCRKSPPSA